MINSYLSVTLNSLYYRTIEFFYLQRKLFFHFCDDDLDHFKQTLLSQT